MLKKTLVSPIALAFGLALTGAAAAQTMIGDQQIAPEDLNAVETHCQNLALASETAATGEEPTVNLDEAANTLSGVELETITLEQCEEAGFVEGPFPTTTPSVSTESDDLDGNDDDDDTDDSNDDDNGDDDNNS